jgi:hypothetical protein
LMSAAVENTPSKAEVIAQLERVIASARFKDAQIQVELLRFVAKHAFARHPIGWTDNAQTFWTGNQDDANKVRSTANLIRKKLKKFYEEEGKDDLVRIALPPGQGYKLQ